MFQLFFLMIIGGFLEMLSVSIMLPLMNAVMNPEEVMDKWYSKFICDFFHISTPTDFIATVCILLAMLYIVKNVYLIMENRLQHRFVYTNMFAVENQLLQQYLDRPYEYFLNIRSSEIIRIVNNDTASVFNLLSILLQLFTELTVSIAVTVAIFIISPGITSFVAVVLLVLAVVIIFIFKPMMNRAGKTTQEARAGLNKWLLQAIHGIKEVKVMKREEFFRRNFSGQGKRLAHVLLTRDFLSRIPKMLIESVSLSAIFIMIAVIVHRGQNLSSMIPVLTVVAMAAIRLLPSVNKISSALGNCAYSEPMLDKVLENTEDIRKREMRGVCELRNDLPKDTEEKKLKTFNHQLELRRITYQYPTGNQEVLSDTEMVVQKGEIIGIAGPSGAGKTTTADIILGLLKPQSGEVLVDGISIYEDLNGWLSLIGYIPQDIFLLDGTIRANVAFGMDESNISEENVLRALEEASLAEFVKSLPKGIDTEIGERGIRLSGGQRERIGIARALFLNPEILIMDEATSSLDNDTEKDIMETIRNLQGKKTMIIIAHRLSTLDFCDRIYQVDKGKIEIGKK